MGMLTIPVGGVHRGKETPGSRGMSVVASTFVALLLCVALISPVEAARFENQVGSGLGQSMFTAVATNGTWFYAVWEERNLVGQSLYFGRSNDGGVTWSRRHLAFGRRPVVAASGEKVYVAWEQAGSVGEGKQIWAMVSADSGDTFAHPARLDADTADSDRLVAAADENGGWVAWGGPGGHPDAGVYVAGTTDGSTWSRHKLGGASSWASVAANGPYVLVAFQSGPDVRASVSSDSGVSFGSTELVAAGGATLPAAAVIRPGSGPERRFLVVWHQRNASTGASEIMVARRSPTGGSWLQSPSLGAAQAAYPWGGPSIAAGGSRVVVAWNSPGNEGVMATSSVDGGMSFASGRVVAWGRPEGYPVVAVPPVPVDRPVATFDWSMPPRFGVDADGDKMVDYSVDPAFIDPTEWRVDLNGCGSSPAETLLYRWSVDGIELAGNTCATSATVPALGAYQVRLEVVDTATGLSDSVAKTVTLVDHLIVSIGDSVASGEGNPDVAVVGWPWDSASKWQDPQCNRSAKAGPALAAKLLEDADPHSSVTFIHLACSGASIIGPDPASGGLLSEYQGIAPQMGAILPPQVDQARSLTQGRTIDAVMVSIGANDLEFSSVVKGCIAHPFCNESFVASDFDSRLPLMPDRYELLASALSGGDMPLVPADRVFISEYFDPTTDDAGLWNLWCALDSGGPVNPVLRITDSEARWAGQHVITELNRVVSDAASVHGWRLVSGIASRYQRHGYCASDSLVVQLGTSLFIEGSELGGFHPNENGHKVYAEALSKAMAPGLLAPTEAPSGVLSPADAYVVWGMGTKVKGLGLTVDPTGPTGDESVVLSAALVTGTAGFYGVAAAEVGAVAAFTQYTSGIDPNSIQAFARPLAKGPSNFSVERVGLVQAPSKPIDLVAGKSTAVEVEITSSFTQSKWVVIDYEITDDNDDTLVSSSTVVSLRPGENRVYLHPSSGAILPEVGTQVTASVVVDPTDLIDERNDLDNRGTSGWMNVRKSRGLEFAFLPMGDTSCAAVTAMVSTAVPFAQAVLPVPDGGISATSSCWAALSLPSGDDPAGEALDRLGVLARVVGIDHVIGVTPIGWLSAVEAANAVGAAYTPTEGAPPASGALVERGQGGSAVVHEVAHTFGLDHVLDTPAPGYWVERRVAQQGTDLLNPILPFDPWLSRSTFALLRARIAVSGEDPAVLVIRGTIDQIGNLTSGPWYQTEGLLDLDFGSTGEITLTYRDATGGVLGSVGFNRGTIEALGAAGTDAAAFSYRVPAPPAGTATLELAYQDSQVVRTISSASPIVTAAVDASSYLLGEDITLTVDATDVDGDILHHAAMVTVDGGSSWAPLAIDEPGSTVVFSAAGSESSPEVIIRVLTTDGVNTTVTDTDPFAVVAPVAGEETIVAFRSTSSAGPGGLWVVGTDGTGERLLEVTFPGYPEYGGPGGYFGTLPRFSPDGSTIAFTGPSPSGVTLDPNYTDIWLVDTNGGEARNLTPQDPPDYTQATYCADWAPDGSHLVMLEFGNNGSNPHLATVNADGSNFTIHTSSDWGYHGFDYDSPCPRWSPSGDRIAYWARTESGVGWDVRMVDVAVIGSTVELLNDRVLLAGTAQLRVGNGGLSWLPDGSGLVVSVERTVPAGVSNQYFAELWLVDDAGTSVLASFRRFVGGREPIQPVVSPDGRSILTRDLPTGSLCILDLGAPDTLDCLVPGAYTDGWGWHWPDWMAAIAEPPPPPAPATPPADAGGPYAAAEDEPVLLDAGASAMASDEVPLAEWDLDGDGEFDDALGLRTDAVFPDPGEYSIRVKLTSSTGDTMVSDPATVSVSATPPSISGAESMTVGVNEETEFGWLLDDPGTRRHTVTVDWGDGSSGPADVGDGGRVTASHSYGAVVEFTITVEACDEGTSRCSEFYTFVEVVEGPTNGPPVAQALSYQIDAGERLLVVPAASDPDGDELWFWASSAPSHGTLSPLVDGTFLYDPVDGFQGVDSFAYTASDGRATSGPAMVTVVVGNDPPVAGDDSIVVQSGTTVIVMESTLLANDFDPDGSELTLAAVYDDPDTEGHALLVEEGAAYSAPDGFIGATSFTYAVIDDDLGAGFGTVVVTVIPEPADNPIPLSTTTTLAPEPMSTTSTSTTAFVTGSTTSTSTTAFVPGSTTSTTAGSGPTSTISTTNTPVAPGSTPSTISTTNTPVAPGSTPSTTIAAVIPGSTTPSLDDLPAMPPVDDGACDESGACDETTTTSTLLAQALPQSTLGRQHLWWSWLIVPAAGCVWFLAARRRRREQEP